MSTFSSNAKYRIHIQDDSPESLKKELTEAARILDGLRHYSKIWKEHYGSFNRNHMKIWEDKADEWIEQHKKIMDNDNTPKIPNE